MTCTGAVWIALTVTVTVIVVAAIIVGHIIWERDFKRRCDDIAKVYLDLMERRK